MRRYAAQLLIGTLLLLHMLPQTTTAQTNKPRARDLGVPFEGTTGPLNDITDVGGVLVGHTTLISGSGQLKVHVCGEYPLAEAAKAQAALEHRETIGKVLLVP